MKKTILIILLLSIIVVFSKNIFAQTASKDINISLLNQNPDPADAGDVVEIRIGLENKGSSSIEKLVLEFVPKYPFELAPGESAVRNIGTMRPYQTGSDMKIIKYQLFVNKDTVAGVYELKIIQYEEGEKTAAYIERTLYIDVESSDHAEIIYIDKVELIPGQKTPMTFTINNVGSAPLRDLTFSWSNEDDIVLPVGSDDTKYIKYIDVGDSVELDYDVIADTNADPGLYKLDLALRYDDPLTGTEKEINTNAGVFVGGGTNFEVAFSESSGGEISFSIANTGSNPAYSVSVIVPNQEGWSVSGSNSVIIGNLNKGDYTVASFTLSQSGSTFFQTSDTEGMTREEMMALRQQRMTNDTETSSTRESARNIQLQIAYTDTMGNRKTVLKEVDMSTSGSTSSVFSAMETTIRQRSNQGYQLSTTAIWAIVIAVMVVAGILGYKFYKRYKKRKKK